MYPVKGRYGMQTFHEFLHSDDRTKPLLPDLNKATRKIVRGQQANASRSTTIIPSHQRLMIVLARAGARGLTRSELSGLVDLEGDTLNDLLTALIKSGEIAVSQGSDGKRVYRRLV